MAKTWLALPRVHCQPFCHNSNRIPSSKNLKKGCGLTSKREKENPLKTLCFQGIGAATQIRTGDLILTNGLEAVQSTLSGAFLRFWLGFSVLLRPF